MKIANRASNMTKDVKPTWAEMEALEKKLEENMCPKLREVLHWMNLMRLTGNDGKDYEHFQWCCSEILKLRRHIKVLETIMAATNATEDPRGL